MLVSRSFFNIEEGSPNQKRAKVNDFELASRLSYFLWSSMPDEPLFAAARSGELHRPDTLAQQVDRMMADAKITRFLDSFPAQWLQLHRWACFSPTPSSTLSTTRGWRKAWWRKPPPTLPSYSTKTCLLREAIDSGWTMLNSRLAIHYGLPAASTRIDARSAGPKPGVAGC